MAKLGMTIKTVMIEVSLRDYFAALAMQGYCGNPSFDLVKFTQQAVDAYKQADAMLKERERESK